MAQYQEQDKETTVSEKRNKFVVVAIDFGTTYSGYAYSFKHDFEKDPTQNIVTNVWGGEKLLSHKAPTCVLFTKEKKFDSFGYEAEDKYADLALEEEEDFDSWFFFEKFKMKLYGQKIHRNLCIKDGRGKEMLAKTVFQESIRYLKDHCLNALTKTKTTLTLEDIHWVLTVPAIWSDAAKQFMREAATKAGLPSALLSIALEPEAASLYCQHLHVEQDLGSAVIFEPPKAGIKYAVVDLGGGTADITVHEKQPEGTLKELTKASGGAWGGMYVNLALESFLISVFGADVYSKFMQECPAAAIDGRREFENQKRSLKPVDEGKKITLCSVHDLINLYNDRNKSDIKSDIQDHPNAGKIKLIAGRIRADFEIFKGFFTPCTNAIVKHIKHLMSEPEVEETKVFLLVGGFSKSSIVYDAIKKAFPKTNVLVPQEAELAVLKGAVIFGHSPLEVSSRIAKYSYGVNISPRFDENIHHVSRKVTVEGVDRCKDAFKKYIEKGHRLTRGMRISGKHVAVETNQSDMQLKIYVSSKTNPKFCDEEETEYAGNLVVKLPEKASNIVVHVSFIVGDTELKVEAEAQESRQIYEAYFDFLC